MLGDSTWREQRLDRNAPSLQKETTSDVVQDGELTGLLSDGWLPHGQPHTVTEGCKEMLGWCPVFALLRRVLPSMAMASNSPTARESRVRILAT